MISLMEGFLPYIRIPMRKILAPNQAKKKVNSKLMAMERNTWDKGGMATLILINIKVGVNKGKREAAITRGVLGFWVTMIPIMKGMISK